jgi:hypothetical protein
MLLKLFAAAGAALAVAGAFAFTAPQVAQAATTDAVYGLCPTSTLNFTVVVYVRPCYSIRPANPGTETVLLFLAVKTTLEAWNPWHQKWETPVQSLGWWHQLAQSGVAGFENNDWWMDEQGQDQWGLQQYSLTWAQTHPWGNFAHYWRLRVEFAWGAPFTYTSPVPTAWVGSATQYQPIGYL